MNFNIILFLIVLHDVKTIPCSFQFEGEESYNEYDRLDLDISEKTTKLELDNINCEDGYMKTRDYFKPKSSDASQADTNEYEEMESSCQIRRRTVIPKALNNIYNKLTKVLNNETFVQAINTEECINTKEKCNSGIVTPFDRKYICRQKFVRITLKALNEKNAVVDEQFFYPSHCVCELVAVKRVKRIRLKKNKRCYDLS